MTHNDGNYLLDSEKNYKNIYTFGMIFLKQKITFTIQNL